MANLEDFDDLLATACRDLLDGPITYTPAGGSPGTIKARVEYAEAMRDIATGKVIEQDITVSVLVADVPARPSSACRVALPKKPGLTYQPVNVRLHMSGLDWLFELAQINA